MKTNNRLITVLYVISRLSFRFSQLILLFAIIFECIPNGTLGSWNSTMHHSKGYSITTQLQLDIPDTLITYKNEQLKINGSVSNFYSKEHNNYFNKIKNDSTLKKKYQINTFEVRDQKYIDVKKEFKNIKIQNTNSTADVIINPKDYFLKAVLIIKSYLTLILVLFVSYQCMRLFEQLRTNFAFDILLNERIKKIGYSFIMFQVANLIISYIITQYFSNIDYFHYTDLISNGKFHFMNLKPVLEYNLQIIFLGLCLVVLSKLLNHGYNLQNENDLTI
ncbi:DUF2975 domain-containing protein [Flavobacterium johnsoniae]|uniref:DUF2975 domain-containing protein n=1 Tax=Flavobacterium johnsoniae TaxID=986 RepID=UPI0025AFE10D|nr:DUF2975 domain-containing protein [Flavobacterium johnsoniae]WJS95584.1 DUF2975 domain-containing protein [Flavobacterium johnsoniae]